MLIIAYIFASIALIMSIKTMSKCNQVSRYNVETLELLLKTQKHVTSLMKYIEIYQEQTRHVQSCSARHEEVCQAPHKKNSGYDFEPNPKKYRVKILDRD